MAFEINRFFNPMGFAQNQQLRKVSVSGNENSLVGFDAQKCIFVHIPKTAGVSLNIALFGNLGGGHKNISDYKFIYRKIEFENYYKFSVVRNPWDRLVSAYFFLKEGGHNELDRKWFNKNLAHYLDFEDFVKNWLTPINIHSWIHFIPQFEFVSQDGENIMDDVFKLEELNENLDVLNLKLNTKIKLGHNNITLSRKKDYRAYYNEKTKGIVEHIYQQDIKYFNYKF